MPRVMWPGCSSKLNASSGSNQKGHSVGGRGRREPLWKWSVKQRQRYWRTAHTRTENRSLNKHTHKAADLGKKCPSVCTLNSLNASRVTAKTYFCALYHTKWVRSVKYGERGKTNVPFCYLKHTTALVCFGICTTITTWQWTCFKRPFLRWERLSCVTHLIKCTLSQQRLLFQVSSSSREARIWMTVERSSCLFIICCL